ncbi:citrate lyase holo-[acyl-carrier protein] synthase [Neobacillus cucumis]|uniref:citrate lyase holo-[acyl-carrier protein] synthase n=1 Tax=Neobacillus cucumis TaxID=1740721 RepID=UPI0019647FD6|nr:citrate lyase holo-[acyl-carrier protein] synthase [Neobacillus cucumis]MBM7653861.1 holo-ACP synthase [Neobacillus cucumis]
MIASQEITLEQILEARERRAALQKQLVEKYRLPLVSFTVNMPGSIKITPESSAIFRKGCKALEEKLKEIGCLLEYSKVEVRHTGYEAYFVVITSERTLKGHMLQIENEHPLGRLFDLDVIGVDGKPISREDLGASKRKCLICEQDAHGCGRSRQHTSEVLMEKIKSMVDSYLKIES